LGDPAIQICSNEGKIVSVTFLDWLKPGANIKAQKIIPESGTKIVRVELPGRKRPSNVFIQPIAGSNDYRYSSTYRDLTEYLRLIPEDQYADLQIHNEQSALWRPKAPESGTGVNYWDVEDRGIARIVWKNSKPISVRLLNWGIQTKTDSEKFKANISEDGVISVDFRGSKIYFIPTANENEMVYNSHRPAADSGIQMRLTNIQESQISQNVRK
jgi:hypothetical protein